MVAMACNKAADLGSVGRVAAATPPWVLVGTTAPSDLEQVTVAGYQFVKYWIDEESNEKSGDQAGQFR
jgi:hypothetical protein